MELFSRLFLIGETGLFLAFLLLLIDHPKRIRIGLDWIGNLPTCDPVNFIQ